MDGEAARLGEALREASGATGPGSRSRAMARSSASILGADGKTRHAPSRCFHLAAINRGVDLGEDREFALATRFTDDDVSEAIGILEPAPADLATEIQRRSIMSIER